jgi:stress responsive alpha/beta barrel protein
MITHIVLFKAHETLTLEQKRSILEAVVAAVKRCPSVRECRIGRRVRHGVPGYEQAMREDYQFALVLEFDDLQGLKDYLAHPEHEKLGGFFATASSASLAYDYELVPLERAHLALGE